MTKYLYQKFAREDIGGEPEDAEALTKEALVQGLDPFACIRQVLTKGIQEVENFSLVAKLSESDDWWRTSHEEFCQRNQH